MTIEYISEGRARRGEAKDEWRVLLNLEMPEVGKLQSLVTLSGSTISVSFTSDSEAVRRPFESSFGDLGSDDCE